MKIGMIGIGDIAKKAYLPVLTQMKGIELHVCTRNDRTLTDIAATYHLSHTYSNIDAWLKNGMDAAFVHSATDSHEQIIDILLDHNIHVYVDKPITYNGDSSQRLIEKAKQKNLILMVGFNLKRGFHNIIKTFLDAVKDKTYNDSNYEEDLQRHLLAERIVQTILEEN